jgi:hypothetical protein
MVAVVALILRGLQRWFGLFDFLPLDAFMPWLLPIL